MRKYLALVAVPLLVSCGSGAADHPSASKSPAADARQGVESLLGHGVTSAQFADWSAGVASDCARYGGDPKEWAGWMTPGLAPDLRTLLEVEGVKFACPEYLSAIRSAIPLARAATDPSVGACETPVQLLSSEQADRLADNC